VAKNNMVIVPHFLYSPNVSSRDFALFPKLKMKLKGQRFERVCDIQRESQEELNSIKENYFHCAFEAWNSDDIAVCIPEETILNEIEAKS
jgi:hypothetical protein